MYPTTLFFDRRQYIFWGVLTEQTMDMQLLPCDGFHQLRIHLVVFRDLVSDISFRKSTLWWSNVALDQF